MLSTTTALFYEKAHLLITTVPFFKSFVASITIQKSNNFQITNKIEVESNCLHILIAKILTGLDHKFAIRKNWANDKQENQSKRK